MEQTWPSEPGMDAAEVLAVVAGLHQAGCRSWIAGGWGVDALVGRQTRPHRDLDLALDAEHEAIALEVLHQRGYRVETDWRPVRVELVAQGRGWVDLHPVAFDARGLGRQADVDGGWFEYPSGSWAEGTLGATKVRCLSREQQVRFHSGYPLRDVDLHDLAMLEDLPPADSTSG